MNTIPVLKYTEELTIQIIIICVGNFFGRATKAAWGEQRRCQRPKGKHRLCAQSILSPATFSRYFLRAAQVALQKVTYTDDDQ